MLKLLVNIKCSLWCRQKQTCSYIGMALSWHHILNQMLIKYIRIKQNVHAASIHLYRGSAIAGASQG